MPPKSKRGGQAPLGLARLDDRKARPGGAVNGGAPAPFILTIDGPGWGCYPAPPLVLPLGFVGLPPGGEGGVFWGEGGFDRLLLKDTRGIIFCPKRFNQKQMIIHT